MLKQVTTSFTTLAIGFIVGVSAAELYHIETRSDACESAQALVAPPMATERDSAAEVLRVWTTAGGPNQFVVEPFWEDVGAWGILLADIARHAANAHTEKYGGDPAMALSRIEELLLSELARPTSPAQQIQ